MNFIISNAKKRPTTLEQLLMRDAGGSEFCRYLNEALVWVEPHFMPQALYLQCGAFFCEENIIRKAGTKTYFGVFSERKELRSKAEERRNGLETWREKL